jgi:MerR family transcriptional regulator, light-induced transcriptional regulator
MKSVDDSQYISTVRAADALGVSVSTIKRWVDENILPAQKTQGGHRKLLRAEVLALARQGELPYRDLTALTVASTRNQPPNLSLLAQSLLAAILRGDGAETSALIRRAYHSAVSIESLADQVIAPAMAEVGDCAVTDRIDIWVEHRATQLCTAAIFDLKSELEARAERNRPIAIGAAPEGDPYLLATVLAQVVLLDNGWEAVNLGPNTPLTSLAKAMRELRPKLLWLSVSHLEDKAAFIRSYRELYRAAERYGVPVAIGGQAIASDVRSTIPYTTYGDGLTQLAAFARTLHPRPKPPRRGRPATR